MRETNEKEFDSILSSGDPIVLDIWAEWCGPCRVMGPMLEDISSAYEGSVSFYKSNVDQNPSLAKRFNVMSIPTMLFFEDGKKIGSVVGAMGPDKIVAKINEAFRI